MKNEKYLQQKFSRKVLVPQTTADFTSRVSKSYVPFTCKFPIVMHSVPILHRSCRSKTNFYVYSYDKIGLKFCPSFRFFLAVFMENFPKIRYLSYVRRGIASTSSKFVFRNNSHKITSWYALFLKVFIIKIFVFCCWMNVPLSPDAEFSVDESALLNETDKIQINYFVQFHSLLFVSRSFINSQENIKMKNL